MSITVASTSQYLFKRNFNENRWANVGTNACKVQVVERSGVFYFKIFDGNETVQHPLAQDSKLHFSKGFVQVPIAETKALYGIKFNDSRDAENFYGKVVRKMGQAWCDQKTGMDSENLPMPYSTYNMGGSTNPAPKAESVAQSLPVSPSTARKHANPPGGQQRKDLSYQMPLRAGSNPNGMPLRAGGGGGGPSNYGVHGGGGGAGGGVSYSSGVHDMPDSGPNARATYAQPPQNVLYAGVQGGNMGGTGGRSQGAGGYGGGQGAGFQQQTGGFVGGQGAGGGFGGGQGPSGGFGGGQGAGFGGQSAGYKGNQGGGYDRGYNGNRFGAEGGGGGGVYDPQRARDSMYAGGQPHQYRHEQQRRVAWDESPPPGQKQQLPPQQVRRANPNPRGQAVSRPPQLKPEDLQGVVMSLMDAINKRDKTNATNFLNALLSSDSDHGSVAMQLSEATPPEKENTFVLNIKVEFQQPEKSPLVIFLDAQESDTIDTLKTKVQVKFFIPKASQHWIIGDTLISSTDFQKSLKDLGISGQYIREAKVFMYVMHAKKANVPKEEIETVRTNQMLQKKRQQGQEGPEFLGQVAMPNQNSFSEAPLPGNYLDHNRGDPPYDVLGNRGYTGAPPSGLFQGGAGNINQPPQSVQNHHQQQYLENPRDPTYSQINMQGGGPRGQGDLITRNAPPPTHTNYPGGARDQMARLQGRSDRMGYGGPRNQPDYQSQHQQQQHESLQAVLGIPAQLQDPNDVVAPPPPPPPEPKKVGWVCQCTWLNAPRRPSCEMCLTDRPADYVVPDDAPVDEATRKAQESERLMQQFMREEKERETKEAQENYRKYLAMDDGEAAVTNKKPFECLICMCPVDVGEGVVLRNCLHQFCKDCLRGSVVNSNEPEIKCPYDDGAYTCGAVVSEREIRAVVSEEELQELYKRGLRQAESAAANSFHCRSNNCEGFCFYEDEVNHFNCPICKKQNCLLCKAIHEDMNCQEYQDDLKRRAANDEAAKETQKMLEALVEKGDAMYCPQCKIIVQKKDGCDWIRCVMCKTEICWATKGPRWGPKGRGDTTGGCLCRVGGKKCHPMCRNCH